MNFSRKISRSKTTCRFCGKRAPKGMCPKCAKKLLEMRVNEMKRVMSMWKKQADITYQEPDKSNEPVQEISSEKQTSEIIETNVDEPEPPVDVNNASYDRLVSVVGQRYADIIMNARPINPGDKIKGIGQKTIEKLNSNGINIGNQ